MCYTDVGGIMKKIILVDGNNLLFRSFYGTSYSGVIMRNSKGFPTNALYGFINMMHKIINEEKPNYIMVAFDKGKSFRVKEFDNYKAGRAKMPEDLKLQFPKAKEILNILGVKYFEIDDYEADDIIGTLAKKVDEEDDFVGTIISSDKDLLQLISDDVVVKKPTSDGYEIVDKKVFYDKYGCDPIKMIDLKALMGDTSDNIPGVEHIGEKSAIELISKYGSLDGVYDNIDNINGKKKEYLINGKKQAYDSYNIATIYRNVPIDFDLDDCKYDGIDYNKFKIILEELEFKSLLRKYNLLDDINKKYSDNNSIDNNSSNQIRLFDDIDNTVIDKDDSFVEGSINEISSDFAFYIETTGEVYSKSNIIGISIYDGKKYYYIKNEDIYKYKDLFSNNYNKYTWDLKKNIVVLNKYGIVIKNCVFDTNIAMYLLDYNIKDDIAFSSKQVGFDIPLYEDIYGTLKRPKDIEFDVIKNICFDKVRLIYNTKAKLYDELRNNEMLDLFNNIEMKLIYVLADMELTGIMIDTKYLEDMKIVIKDKLDKLEREIYDLAGEEFNIMSTKQLSDILFVKLGINYPKKGNKYSVSKDILEKLTDYDIINKILEYKQYQKLYSTYIVGLLDEVRSDNRIHTIYTQTLTRTGRLSSISPNLQNIPARSDFSKLIRKAFLPDKDCLLLSSDYSQVELRIFASISNAENMIDAFNNNIDIHTKTASDIYHVPIEEVTKDMRRSAKAVNFGIIYGISGFGLSEDLGIDIKDAKKFLDDYLCLYPQIKDYMNVAIEKVKEDGYSQTLMGRRRKIDEINSANFLIRQQGERMALNTPIQGTSADIIKKAMIEIYDELNKRCYKSKILLQIHDELILNVYKDEEEEVTKLVKRIMENTFKLKVPLEVSMSVGNNWYEAK